jgi:hypothetical protein
MLEINPLDVEIPRDYDGPDLDTTTRDKFLCDSISRNGVRNPIFLSPSGPCWDGVRRTLIARRLGVNSIPYVVVASVPSVGGRTSLFRVVNRLWHDIAEVLTVVKQSEEESATGRPGVRSEAAIEALNLWRAIEEATGYSREWLTQGFQLFNQLHATEGEEATRALSTFRNYGLAATLRMLDTESGLSDDGQPDPAVNRLDYGVAHLIKPRVDRVEVTDKERFLNVINLLEQQFPQGSTYEVERGFDYLKSIARGING